MVENRTFELVGPHKRFFDVPGKGKVAGLAADTLMTASDSSEQAVYVLLINKETGSGLFLGMDRAAATRHANRVLEAVANLTPRKDGL